MVVNRICSLNYPTEKLFINEFIFYRFGFFNLNFAVISMFNCQSSSLLSKLVGTSGLEPPTSRLSGVRSNHLSYAPMSLAIG